MFLTNGIPTEDVIKETILRAASCTLTIICLIYAIISIARYIKHDARASIGIKINLIASLLIMPCLAICTTVASHTITEFNYCRSTRNIIHLQIGDGPAIKPETIAKIDDLNQRVDKLASSNIKMHVIKCMYPDAQLNNYKI